MFELSGVPEPTAREAMRLAMHKLPIKDPLRGPPVTRADMASKTADLRELNDHRARAPAGRGEGRGCSTSASRTPLVSSTNISRIPQVRREVARIETLLREREITAAEQLEAQE